MSRGATATLRALALSLLVSVGLGAHCNSGTRAPEDAVEDPGQLVDLMTGRAEGVSSARYRVVSEYYGGDLRGANFRQVVLIRQPADIHVQILSPFDQTLQVLVSNDEALSLYDFEHETFYRGAPTPENLARLLPFYLSAADIVRVLVGGPPLDLMSDDRAAYALSWNEDDGLYRLVVPLATGDGTLELGVRHGDWAIASARRLTASGEQVFELRTGDFELQGGLEIPMRLRFLLDRPEEIDMSLDVERVEIDPTLPDSLFELQPPAGVEVIDL